MAAKRAGVPRLNPSSGASVVEESQQRKKTTDSSGLKQKGWEPKHSLGLLSQAAIIVYDVHGLFGIGLMTNTIRDKPNHMGCWVRLGGHTEGETKTEHIIDVVRAQAGHCLVAGCIVNAGEIEKSQRFPVVHVDMSMYIVRNKVMWVKTYALRVDQASCLKTWLAILVGVYAHSKHKVPVQALQFCDIMLEKVCIDLGVNWDFVEACVCPWPPPQMDSFNGCAPCEARILQQDKACLEKIPSKRQKPTKTIAQTPTVFKMPLNQPMATLTQPVNVAKHKPNTVISSLIPPDQFKSNEMYGSEKWASLHQGGDGVKNTKKVTVQRESATDTPASANKKQRVTKSPNNFIQPSVPSIPSAMQTLQDTTMKNRDWYLGQLQQFNERKVSLTSQHDPVAAGATAPGMQRIVPPTMITRTVAPVTMPTVSELKAYEAILQAGKSTTPVIAQDVRVNAPPPHQAYTASAGLTSQLLKVLRASGLLDLQQAHTWPHFQPPACPPSAPDGGGSTK